MASVTFEDIHAHFHERLREPKIAAGDLFHYYKIFQHAASYELHQSTSKILKNTVDRPIYKTRFRYLMRQLIREQHRSKLAPVVLLDDHRTIETPIGKQSYYFDRIARLLPLNGISIVADKDEPSAFEWTVTKADTNKYANRKLGLASRRVLKDIHKVLGISAKVYGTSSLYYQYLASCFTNFFEDFHRYYNLFEGQNVKQLFITMHYHREGLIAAARMHGIEVLEFQHGLIAEQDLYYVYPNQVATIADHALFPDKIYVFGQYWKDVLLRGFEFNSEQIIVAGDYSLQSSGRARYYGATKENAILIGAQKNMPELYVKYIENLLELLRANYPEWKVWVKLHPLEKEPNRYAHLNEHAQCEVFGKGSELMHLLCRCKIQVSIYSTTFFDALGLGVMNFSVQNYGDYTDYARAMVSEKVAFPIAFGEDPIEKFRIHNANDLLALDAVYGPFNLQL